MALSISVRDKHDQAEKSISLYIQEYEFLMERIENTDGFPLLNSVLLNYYGIGEVYINELPAFKNEILAFEAHYTQACSREMTKFLVELGLLVEYAITEKKTIQFVGD
jgi:hypothetical protein